MVKLLMIAAALCCMATAASAAETDALERNKVVARTVLEEVLGKGKIAENEHLYAPTFAAHGLNGSQGRDADRAATRAWRSAFPNLRITVDKVVAEGNLVVIRFIGEGDNTGEGMGFPPTGRHIRASGITIFRIVDGKITDEWSEFNELAFMRSLGLLGAGGAPK